MTITLIPSLRQQTQHILLEDVTWVTYQALLKELGDHRASRLASDQGVLEIIMTSASSEPCGDGCSLAGDIPPNFGLERE